MADERRAVLAEEVYLATLQGYRLVEDGGLGVEVGGDAGLFFFRRNIEIQTPYVFVRKMFYSGCVGKVVDLLEGKSNKIVKILFVDSLSNGYLHNSLVQYSFFRLPQNIMKVPIHSYEMVTFYDNILLFISALIVGFYCLVIQIPYSYKRFSILIAK